MANRFAGALSVLLLTAAASAHGDASLRLSLPFPPPQRVEPGEILTYGYSVLSSGPELVKVRLTHQLGPGGRLIAFKEENPFQWHCTQESSAVVCNALMPFSQARLTLTVTAPDDPAGLVFPGAARLDSDRPDPFPADNETRWPLTVYRTFTVTTPDDFGAGSLRDAIERANAACDASHPCKIRFAEPMRIAPRAPLPRVTACDTLIDGGGYRAERPHYSFNAPRRVEISGEHLSFGNGFVLAGKCGFRFHPNDAPVLMGLAVHSFPENGVSVEEPGDGYVKIVGCSIGANAAGTEARPNLRGISVDAPAVRAVIEYSLIAGNARSGVAIWRTKWADVWYNLIGVRFGGAPLPNGASGMFVNSGEVRTIGNTIEYNRDFGVAVGPNVYRYVSTFDYIALNGNIAVDWGLDGPTANDHTGRMPPVPQLLDAYFDPARQMTIVRGVVPPSEGIHIGDLHAVRVYAGGGDHEGGLNVGGRPLGYLNSGGRPFEIELRGNYTGQTITADIERYYQPDWGPVDSSEISAAIRVR